MAEQSKKSRRQKMAEAGVTAQQYTIKGWFVRIYPCLSIGLYKFSFAEKGKNGEGFDIYMSIEDLELWVDDILDVTKTFKKTLLEEKAAGEKYPKAYKYVTGANAAKSIGLCPSTLDNAFATINGSVTVNGKKVFANVPVDYNWLRKFAKEFRRETAGYFRDMTALTLEKASQFRAHVDEDEMDAAETPNANAASTETTEAKPPENKTAKPADEKPPVQKTEPKVEANNGIPFCEYLKSTTKLMPLKNTKDILVIKCTNKDNAERIIYFMPPECKTAGDEFTKFKKTAEERTGVGFNILISPVNGKMVFQNFVVG